MKSLFRTIKKGIATCVAITTVCASFVVVGFGTNTTARADTYNPGIVTFVTSLYSDCLGRTPDPTGLNDWCNKLQTGQITGKQCAYGFFFSPEFQAKANAWDDTTFINAYYKVFLNRGSDPSGFAYWQNKINGTTNDISILFTGFADSTEFASKCASYGITVGPHVDVPTTVRGTSSSAGTSSGGSSASTGNLAAQTNGTRANSVEELDAYWTSQGYEIMYIDLGNGATQKVYAKFYDMTEHYNQVNAWRNQNGLPSLAVISDPNDVRYQHARTRAVEVAYKFAHARPCETSDPSTWIDPPGNEAGENIYGGSDAVASFEAFRNSRLHAAGMRCNWANYITAVGCFVVFVNADGVSTTTSSPSTGTGRATAQILWT